MFKLDLTNLTSRAIPLCLMALNFSEYRFKTVKGHYVCANPTDSWVKENIKIIDSRNVGSQGTL